MMRNIKQKKGLLLINRVLDINFFDFEHKQLTTVFFKCECVLISTSIKRIETPDSDKYKQTKKYVYNQMSIVIDQNDISLQYSELFDNYYEQNDSCMFW